MKNTFLLLGLIAAAWFVGDVAINKFGLQFQNAPNTALGMLPGDFRSGEADRSTGYFSEDSYPEREAAHRGYTSEDKAAYDGYGSYAGTSDYTPAASRATDKPVRKSGKKQVVDVNEWVGQFTAQAFLEAQKKDIRVPATLSLALGLDLMRQGERIETKEDFVRKVVNYLVAIKKNASGEERKAYFQYAANSDNWLKGMERKGISTTGIREMIARYDLDAYDEVVFEQITKKQLSDTRVTRVQTKSDKPVFVGSKTDKEAVRKHAEDLNKWVDSELSGSSHNVKFAASGSSSSASEARKTVSRLKVGESVYFDDVAEFEQAVKEMVALEADYDSWKAYEADQSAKARKQFRERSNVMANGLELKVTRKR
jgi:hypothetical protein